MEKNILKKILILKASKDIYIWKKVLINKWKTLIIRDSINIKKNISICLLQYQMEILDYNLWKNQKSWAINFLWFNVEFNSIFKGYKMDERTEATKWKIGVEAWYFLTLIKLVYLNKNIILWLIPN